MGNKNFMLSPPDSPTNIGLVNRNSNTDHADFSFFYEDLMFFIKKSARTEARALEKYETL